MLYCKQNSKIKAKTPIFAKTIYSTFNGVLVAIHYSTHNGMLVTSHYSTCNGVLVTSHYITYVMVC